MLIIYKSVTNHVLNLFLSNMTFVTFQNENRALRLKDGVTLAQYQDSENSIIGVDSGGGSSNFIPQLTGDLTPATDTRLTWAYFDEIAYVHGGGLRPGEDPYVRNRFNQEASDSMPSNRDIPDTRNAM